MRHLRSADVDGIVWRGLGKLAHHFHDFNVEKFMMTLDILKRVFNGREIGSEDPEDDSKLPSSKAVEGRIFAVEKEFYEEFLEERRFLPEVNEVFAAVCIRSFFFCRKLMNLNH